MKTNVIPSHHCPCCQRKLDCATYMGKEKRKPKPSDLTICMYCTTLLQFDESLCVKELSAQEINLLDARAQAQVRFLQKMLRLFWARTHRYN